MKTVNELREELKIELADCIHVNDGSLAAKVDEQIQWAWENWGDSYDYTEHFEGDEKPEIYTDSFRDEWIDNEDFDAELEQINTQNETFTIVKKGTENHYDTNDERFYDGKWDRTHDTKEYLETLIENSPEKFEGCEIQYSL